MSFSKFLIEQAAEEGRSTAQSRITPIAEGGNLGGSLENQLQAINQEMEEVLGKFLQTLKSHRDEWDNLTDTTGYFPPKSKVSSGIWNAQREIADALDHFQYMQDNQGNYE